MYRSIQTQYQKYECKTALNRVQHMDFNWSLNPYQGCAHACVYCFARAHAKIADRDPGAGFSAKVGVKINVAEVLRKELGSRHWKGESVAFGTATDPYQPAEGIYKLTRKCLEAFRDYHSPVSLITKGTLIVRDIDVLVELARRADLTVTFSIPTVDENIWRKTEPGTPPPRKRLEALKKLVAAGINAGVGMAPLLPGLSDSRSQIEDTIRAAAEAGACYLWSNLVYLKPGTREYFFDFLRKEFPRLIPQYERLFQKPYLPYQWKRDLQEQVGTLRRIHPVWDRRAEKLEPPPAPVQMSMLAR